MIHLMCWLKGIREGKRTDSKVISWWFHITISLAVREEQSLGFRIILQELQVVQSKSVYSRKEQTLLLQDSSKNNTIHPTWLRSANKGKDTPPKSAAEHMSIVWMRLRRVMTLWGYTDDSSLSFACPRSLGACYAMLGHVELWPPKKDMFKSKPLVPVN